jgi:serine/threonine-protein kinase
MIRKTTVFIFSMLFASSAMAVQFGAIAYSPSDKAYGYSYNWNNKQQARKKARQKCRAQRGSPDCKVLTLFNRCGALAIGKGGRKSFGSGKGQNRNVAKKRAIAQCRKKGGRQCRAPVVVCN